MRCRKHPYRDKDLALHAMHGIGNKKDGRNKPIRVYLCDDCGYWHMTSKQIGDMLKDPLVLTLDWSKIINNNKED